MELSGKIKVIQPTQEVSQSFKKREFVITTDEQYAQHIQVEFAQDKCVLLDNHKVGDDVKVSINVRGREWVNPEGQAKYFNTLVAWRIERLASNGQQQSVSQNTQQTSPQYQAPPTQVQEPQDDVPF